MKQPFNRLRMPLLLGVFSLLLFFTAFYTAEGQADVKLRRAGDSSLQIEGDVTLVVNSLPFRVVCPEAADLYFWRMPVGWDGSDGGVAFTVATAPQGTAVVSLQTLKIDWEAKKTTVKSYSLKVNVGVLPGPNPPPPPPPPPPLNGGDKELTKALQDAYAKDFSIDKASLKAKLADIYRVAAKAVYTDLSLKTLGDVDNSVRTQAQTQLGLLTIPAVRNACGAWLATKLPTNRTTPLDTALQARISTAYATLAKTLDTVN